MDVLDLAANTQVREHFLGLKRPCPSKLCDGFLEEYVQETWQPFKAFLMCPKCESRLRVVRKEK